VGQYVFSAKGAAFISSLGQRPRDTCNAKPSALKARFIPAPICVGSTVNRRVESRFQRWSIVRSKSWGDAPGLYESALLALSTYVGRASEHSPRGILDARVRVSVFFFPLKIAQPRKRSGLGLYHKKEASPVRDERTVSITRPAARTGLEILRTPVLPALKRWAIFSGRRR
jgi:hypothetical protein